MHVTATADSHRTWMRAAGALIALGALAMLAKGVLLMVTDIDRSLVPWFGLLSSAGLATAALALRRTVGRLRWLAAVSGMLASIGVIASLVAVGYLITGTIPETNNAPAAVGASYALLAAGSYLALLTIGIVIAKNRALAGRWRWFPLALIAAQFPIFIVADAIGDGFGPENVTDGLGLALTGAGWTALGYAMTRPRPVQISLPISRA